MPARKDLHDSNVNMYSLTDIVEKKDAYSITMMDTEKFMNMTYKEDGSVHYTSSELSDGWAWLLTRIHTDRDDRIYKFTNIDRNMIKCINNFISPSMFHHIIELMSMVIDPTSELKIDMYTMMFLSKKIEMDEDMKEHGYTSLEKFNCYFMDMHYYSDKTMFMHA